MQIDDIIRNALKHGSGDVRIRRALSSRRHAAHDPLLRKLKKRYSVSHEPVFDVSDIDGL